MREVGIISYQIGLFLLRKYANGVSEREIIGSRSKTRLVKRVNLYVSIFYLLSDNVASKNHGGSIDYATTSLRVGREVRRVRANAGFGFRVESTGR